MLVIAPSTSPATRSCARSGACRRREKSCSREWRGKWFGAAQLAEMQRVIDGEKSDIDYVLAHIEYALPPRHARGAGCARGLRSGGSRRSSSQFLTSCSRNTRTWA